MTGTPKPPHETRFEEVETVALAGSTDLFLRAKTPAVPPRDAGARRRRLLHLRAALLRAAAAAGVLARPRRVALRVEPVAVGHHRDPGRRHAGGRPHLGHARAQADHGGVALRRRRADGGLRLRAGLGRAARGARADGRGAGRRAGGGDGLPRRGGAPARPRRRHGPLHRRQRLRRHARPRRHRRADRLDAELARRDRRHGPVRHRRRGAVHRAAAALAPLRAGGGRLAAPPRACLRRAPARSRAGAALRGRLPADGRLRHRLQLPVLPADRAALRLWDRASPARSSSSTCSADRPRPGSGVSAAATGAAA